MFIYIAEQPHQKAAALPLTLTLTLGVSDAKHNSGQV